jgi:hypothetical protein
VFLFAEPACSETTFAAGFGEWKSLQPRRYSQENWERFWPTQALDGLFRPRMCAPYSTLLLHQVDGEQNDEAHEVLFHGLLSGDADGARTDGPLA